MTAPTTEKQSTPLHGPNLILDVQNFGPIAEAKNIEFKPMTVLVGPSNTGKTYLAVLLHALLTAKSTTRPTFAISSFGGTDEHPIAKDPRFEAFSDEVKNSLDQIIESNEPLQEGYWYKARVSDFTSLTQSLFWDITEKVLIRYASSAKRTIPRYFDVSNFCDLANRSKNLALPPKVQIRDKPSGFRVSIQDSNVELFNAPEFVSVDPDIFSVQGSADTPPWVFSRNRNFGLDMYARSALSDFPRTHYFRAGRTGLIDAYRELAAAMIGRDPDNFSRNHPGPLRAASLATSEFLQNLVVLRPHLNVNIQDKRMIAVAEVLERGVLGGTVNVKETASLSYFEFDKDGVAIPIEQASSMVTELATLVMFIRHHVEPYDLLIIDEPEAHLHPEAQQQMAAALAFMVRSGLRVLITTHSHYMVEQLSAFVNASKLDETTRKRALSLDGALGKEDIYLNEDETAVYSFAFSDERGGSVVNEIFMGEEYEYGPDDHSDATVRQFNRSQSVLEAREKAEANGLD